MQHGVADHGTDALALAGALCARVCHDLAGTLGALAGMLDMVAEAPDLEALDLARDCARDLSDRLRLLRAAWGSDSEMPDLATLLPGLPGAKRLRVDLAGLDAEEASVAQLGASLLLVAAGALPRGGAIRLAGGGRHLSLHLEGPKAAWPAGLEAGQPAEPGPRGVAVAMACLQAHALGWSIDVRSPVELTAG